jgi:hypothetical protein
MKPFQHITKGICLLLWSLAMLGIPLTTHAQNLNGIKIQVASEALTYLKFNADIKRFEFGDHDDYTAQVVENDQLRIKTLNNKPTPTNLVVTEGNRTHMFIIQVMSKIDINNFKAYYDYSDLKALKKLAATSTAGSGETVAANTEVPETKTDPKAERKAEKERKAREEKELAARKDQDKKDAAARQAAADRAKKDEEDVAKARAEEARELQLKKERDLAAAKEKERLKQEALVAAKQEAEDRKKLNAEKIQRDKEAAAAKQRAQQLEKERQQELAEAAKREAAEEKQRQADEKARLAREAQRSKEIAAAKEKDRQAALAKAEAQRKEEERKQQLVEQARQEKKDKEAAVAKEKQRQREAEEQKAKDAEKERQRQEDIARQKEEALKKDRERQEEKLRQQQVALERENARKEEQLRKAEEARILAEKRAQERADALVTNKYRKTDWYKKYPQINFAEPPVGQLLTGEYFLPKDTLTNSLAAQKAMAEPVRISKLSEKADGVTVKMEGISFSGVNAYIRLRISNDRDKDFLVGKMIMTWWKKGGGSYYLKPCYVTEFPVIYPGKEVVVVFACRGVNASDDDDFAVSVADRLNPNQQIQLPFTGKVYNKEMNR